MAKIKNVLAREILDSRGNPTIEVDMILDNDIFARACVPSGASTGEREAVELRDNDEKRYNGKGVLKAVRNVNTTIRDAIVGMELDQVNLDKKLIELDGTKNKSNLGANAILGVSLASIYALSKLHKKEVFEFLSSGNVSLPLPMMNIINGGEHANNSVDIQEFMIVPVIKTFKERLRCGAEIFHTLAKILEGMNLSTAVGDEGGFAPDLKSNEEALELINKAIISSGYVPGKDVFIALDVAASSMYDKESNKYKFDGCLISKDELIEWYKNMIEKYSIMSIEDPFEEDDYEAFAELTRLVGNKIMVVGDDLFVTNVEYLKKGIEMGAGNAILLKPNQIGTITELTNTIALARKNNYKMILSHRSGETEGTFIADAVVGMNIPFIKTGSLSRTDRIGKYNQLLRIEEKILG